MKKIILLGGKIDSGKNFVCTNLKNLLEEEGNLVDHLSFGERVKDISREGFKKLSEYINFTIEKITKQLMFYDEIKEIKNSLDILKNLKIEDNNWYEEKTEFTRILIQSMATDIVRKHIDSEFWIKQVISKIKNSKSNYFIFSDFRFENEYLSLKEFLKEQEIDNTIVTILVERDVDRLNNLIHKHESEVSLESFVFDYIFNNNLEYNIENFKRLVKVVQEK